MKISSMDKKIIIRILCLFKPYKKKVAVILVCMLVSAGISMVIPRISQQIMDSGLLAYNYKLLILLTLAAFGLLLIDQCLGFWGTKNRLYLNSIISYTLSKNAFKHTLRMRMDFLNSSNAPEIMSTIGMDVGNIGKVCDSGTFFILASIFKMIGGFIGLLIIDWRLTAMVVVIVPFRYILVKYIAKKRKLLFEQYLEANREFAAFYGDTVAGVKEVKLWGLDRIMVGRFIKSQRNLVNLSIKMGLIDKLNELSETVIFQLITDLVYVVGAYFVFGNSLTVGELFAFITYSSYITGPISAILNIGYNFANIIPSAKRYFDFIDTEGEPYVKCNGESVSESRDSTAFITYESVSFSYSDEKRILDNISFKINKGEKVAIVGANGSGKSTIVNLLLRLYQPDSGKILLDGVDINSINLREYRKMISVVSQDMYLFNASIKNNITLNSKMTELDNFKAVRKFGISEFVEKLPDKYETVVGRNGAKVSGGERQKIALARALVRDSKILVLDEATANYDIESEAAVNEFIGKSLNEKTAIIISHKPDILRYVDKVIVLEKGRVVDAGKHDELCGRNSMYKKMMEACDASTGKQAI